MKVYNFIVFILSIFVCCNTYAQQPINSNEKVDEVITRNIDITGDGVPENIKLHIKGKSFKHPFVWTLDIFSGETNIFKHESDDTWLDKFFHDEGYVSDECNGYLECKRQYYFHDILGGLVIITDLSVNPQYGY